MISVIMPTNRIDAHFDIAVRSILDSADVDLELIIVFDAIAADIDRFDWLDDSRIRTVTTPEPSGPAGTMKHGLKIAAGAYVARMDADDYSHPDRLAVQHRYLDDHPDVVAVSCRTRRIDETGAYTGDINLPAGDDVRPHLLLQNVVPHSTLVARRTAIDAVGGYRTDLAQMEDYVLMLELARVGRMAQLPDRMLDYRVHSAQTSRAASHRGHYVTEVLAARRRLARHLGANRLASEMKNVTWLAVQLSRSTGLLRPRHAW